MLGLICTLSIDKCKSKKHYRSQQEDSYHLLNTFDIPGTMLSNVWTLFYVILTLILGVGAIVIPILRMRRSRLGERNLSKIRGQEVEELEFKARKPHPKASVLLWYILVFLDEFPLH